MRDDLDRFLQSLEGETKRTSLSKAADPLIVSVMNSASLKRELATEFINLVVNESTLLQNIRVKQVDAPSGDLVKLNITTNVLEKATENTDSGNTRRPTDTALTYNTVKLRAALDYSGEWEEDNIEGSSGISTVLQAFSDALANDHEVLAISGDASVSGTTDYQRLVKANDGFHVLTASGTGAVILNAAAKRPSYQLLSDMLKLMPTKYKRDLSKLRWIMSWGTAMSLVDEIAGRVTEYSEVTKAQGLSVLDQVLNIKVLIVPYVPEDLTLTGTSGTTGTFIWLTDPQNFISIFQREISMEKQRIPRSDRTELTMYLRTDYLVENAAAVVKATNVSLWSGHSRYT